MDIEQSLGDPRENNVGVAHHSVFLFLLGGTGSTTGVEVPFFEFEYMTVRVTTCLTLTLTGFEGTMLYGLFNSLSCGEMAERNGEQRLLALMGVRVPADEGV